MKQKTAVVLFNLGGPDNLEAVEPFLFNLFNDPAIIRLPTPFRWLLAKLISKTRKANAQGIYAQIGGSSPLLQNTQAQAKLLEANLNQAGINTRIFMAMRYWNPRIDTCIEELKAWKPDEIILLPLYPHYSTTTTKSSFDEWDFAIAHTNLNGIPTRRVCSYHADDLLIGAHVELLRPLYEKACTYGIPKVLFSAHSLPQKIVDAGDPYLWQTEETAARITQHMKKTYPYIETQVCYQSKVGPLKWLTPSTEACIEHAAQNLRPLVVVPISFVSDHSETLVELDIDYRDLALSKGCPHYARVPALACTPLFIKCLEKQVQMLTSPSPSPALTTQDILSPEIFEIEREKLKSSVLALKKIRRLEVGPDITFYFENKETLLWQIHEMLRIEGGGVDQIQDELTAFAPLVPKVFEDGSGEFVATMMIEIEGAQRRKILLSEMGGIEKHIFLSFADTKIPASAEQDVERTTEDGKTSAVHFLRFKLSPDQCVLFEKNAVSLNINHLSYHHHAVLPQTLVNSLLSDLS